MNTEEIPVCSACGQPDEAQDCDCRRLDAECNSITGSKFYRLAKQIERDSKGEIDVEDAIKTIDAAYQMGFEDGANSKDEDEETNPLCRGCRKKGVVIGDPANAISRYGHGDLCPDCGRREAAEGDFIAKEEDFTCPKCGSKDFEVNEGIVHTGTSDGQGHAIHCSGTNGNEIENVFCADCGEELEIPHVEFN
jgi:Zn finger protein HypA/HybF involved in hydrogenase expression